MASRRFASSITFSPGTKMNSGSLSTNFLISHGQATRSTFTCSRVIHFMMFPPQRVSAAGSIGRAAGCWVTTKVKGKESLASMRNHLDKRALRRAWTNGRLTGACVSLVVTLAAVASRRKAAGRLTTTGTRRNIAEPVTLHCLVSPEIDINLDRRRLPVEAFAEVHLGGILLEAREPDFESAARVFGASRGIDRNGCAPFSLQCRRLHR